MRQPVLIVGLVWVFVGGLAREAQATPLRFGFAGSFTCCAVVGAFTGYFDFDSVAVDTDPSPGVGAYSWITPAAGMTLKIGSQVFSDYGSLRIVVQDLPGGFFVKDSYSVSGSFMSFVMTSSRGSPSIISDALPLVPPRHGDFDFNPIRVGTPFSEPFFSGEVIELFPLAVPEPGTFMLLGTGLTGVIARLARRRRTRLIGR